MAIDSEFPGGERQTQAASPADAAAVEQLVSAERIHLLYRLTPRTLATAALFSVIVFLALRPVVPLALLGTWFAAVNVVSLIRFLDIRAYRRAQPTVADMRRWQRRFVGLTAVAGTLWGMMGTLLYPHGHPNYEAIVTVFLVGTAAVGMFTLYSSWIAYLALAIPTLLPGAVYLFVGGGDLGVALGAAIAFFLLIVIVNSRTSVRNTSEMLRLRFENARIAEQREAALRDAEAAGRAKMQFLANMSHEIRTPLNGILGMTQLLRSTPLDAQQRRRLDTLDASGEHLLGLLNDVLDIAKVDAGKLDIEHRPFDLRRALREVTDLLAPRAEARALELVVRVVPEVPGWVVGDAARLKQVLANLIGNAIKFTETGRIDVDVSTSGADRSPAARLRFAVRDTGVGIADADQAKLFAPFSQVDASSTRRHGGSGLGLAISRHLVELMGGRIDVASEPGRGSTFRVDIPLPAGAAPPDAPRADPVAGSARLAGSVLLVEDHPVNLEIAKAMLEEFGLAIECAGDGAEAIEHATRRRFDVILMDCQLPGIDGYEATRQIIAHERDRGHPHVPIIALTANAIRGDRERCLEAGMDDYLAKPFRGAELESMLRRWLPGGAARAGDEAG